MDTTESLLEATLDTNRLLMHFMLSHQDVNRATVLSPARMTMTALGTAERWAEKYGECVTPSKAAKIIGRTPSCISNWIANGMIIRYPTGMIDTRALAIYMVSGAPQGNAKVDPLRKQKSPSMGKDALETIDFSHPRLLADEETALRR